MTKEVTRKQKKRLWRVDQVYLRPLLQITPSPRNRVACEYSSKELFEQLMLFLFGTSTWLPKCMWPQA